MRRRPLEYRLRLWRGYVGSFSLARATLAMFQTEELRGLMRSQRSRLITKDLRSCDHQSTDNKNHMHNLLTARPSNFAHTSSGPSTMMLRYTTRRHLKGINFQLSSCELPRTLIFHAIPVWNIICNFITQLLNMNPRKRKNANCNNDYVLHKR